MRRWSRRDSSVTSPKIRKAGISELRACAPGVLSRINWCKIKAAAGARFSAYAVFSSVRLSALIVPPHPPLSTLSFVVSLCCDCNLDEGPRWQSHLNLLTPLPGTLPASGADDPYPSRGAYQTSDNGQDSIKRLLERFRLGDTPDSDRFHRHDVDSSWDEMRCWAGSG